MIGNEYAIGIIERKWEKLAEIYCQMEKLAVRLSKTD